LPDEKIKEWFAAWKNAGWGKGPEPKKEEPAEETPELAENQPAPVSTSNEDSATIDIDIHPSDLNPEDTFALVSTDGSYKKTLKVCDDKIQNDDKITLEFKGLMKNKSYTLKHGFAGTSIAIILFEDISYDQLMDSRK
jgi:hypothetical protein